jgi:hypothetical protein
MENRPDPLSYETLFVTHPVTLRVCAPLWCPGEDWGKKSLLISEKVMIEVI